MSPQISPRTVRHSNLCPLQIAACSSVMAAAALRGELEAGALRAVDCPGLGQDAAPVRASHSSGAVESVHPDLFWDVSRIQPAARTPCITTAAQRVLSRPQHARVLYMCMHVCRHISGGCLAAVAVRWPAPALVT